MENNALIDGKNVKELQAFEGLPVLHVPYSRIPSK